MIPGPLIELVYEMTKDSALDIFYFVIIIIFLENRTEYRPVHSAIYSTSDRLGEPKPG